MSKIHVVKYLAIGFILMITSFCKAQTAHWSELFMNITTAYEQEEYEEVAASCNQLLALTNNATQKAKTYLLAAKSLHKIGEFSQADSLLSLANFFNTKSLNNLSFDIQFARLNLYLEAMYLNRVADELPILQQYTVHPIQQFKLLFLKGKYEVEIENYEQAKATLKQANHLLETITMDAYMKSYFRSYIAYQRAELYLQTENVERSQSYLDTAYTLPKNTLHYSSHLALINQCQGRLFFSLKDIEAARKSYWKAANEQQITLSNMSRDYAISLCNIANLETSQGNLQEAEELTLAALNIFENYTKSDYWASWANVILSEVLVKIGRVDEALIKLKNAKAVFALYEKTADHIQVNNLMIQIYQQQHKQNSIRLLLNENLETYKAKHGEHDIKYASILYHLADYYLDQQDYEKSIYNYEKVKTSLANLIGTEHPSYANVLNNLAYAYQTTHQLELAKTTYLEMEAIDRKTIGEQHPDFVYSQYNIANLFWQMQLEEAAVYYQRANEGQLNLIYDYYSGFDEATRLSYLKEAQKGFNEFYAYVFHHAEATDLVEAAQNLNLATKGLALDFGRTNRLEALAEQSPTVQLWQQKREALAEAYSQSQQAREEANIDLMGLKKEVEALEKQVVRDNPNLQQQLQFQQRYTAQDLQRQLKKDAVSIDFTRAQYRQAGRSTDSIFYYAILNYGDRRKAEFVLLAEEKKLQQLLQNSSDYVRYEQIGTQLYQAVWQPLRSYLEGIKDIHLSLDGLLHRLNFAALPEGNKLLFDSYNFHYYNHLRDFIEQRKIHEMESAALFGGAYFDLDSLSLSQLKVNDAIIEIPLEQWMTQDALASRSAENETTRSAVYFNYLSGTKTEVQQISQQLARQNKTYQLYLAEQALEDHFKTFDASTAPNLIHIATHGYFFEQQKTDNDSTLRDLIISSDQALMRSGLVFTGVNHTWQGGRKLSHLEDGVLTALEISNLNLSNTQLVVLSACETGKGDIQSGEGVFGLQRAFKMAGVEQLIYSLWKVPDAPTAELMQAFYRFYAKGQTAERALQLAQRKMRKKYAVQDWAAFVLVN